MIASASLRFCPRFGRRPRDIVAGHGSLLTLRWREVDSNSQSPITKVAASGERQRGQALLNVPVCGWDREFESPLLQRGVRCELDPTASASCLLRATRPFHAGVDVDHRKPRI